MDSPAGAIPRRFLLGPLVVLALLGPAGDVTGDGGVTIPRASDSPTPAGATDLAKAALMDAFEAEQVYRVDHLVFAAGVGGELDELRTLDPSVAWGTAVIVEVPASEGEDNLVVVLRASLPGGGGLCLSEVTTEQEAGIWYARALAGAPCPKVRRGMRGWSPDEATGWRPA